MVSPKLLHVLPKSAHAPSTARLSRESLNTALKLIIVDIEHEDAIIEHQQSASAGTSDIRYGCAYL